jgi:hypothetical protein
VNKHENLKSIMVKKADCESALELYFHSAFSEFTEFHNTTLEKINKHQNCCIIHKLKGKTHDNIIYSAGGCCLKIFSLRGFSNSSVFLFFYSVFWIEYHLLDVCLLEMEFDIQ